MACIGLIRFFVLTKDKVILKIHSLTSPLNSPERLFYPSPSSLKRQVPACYSPVPLVCLLLNSQVSLHGPLPPAVKGCLPLHVFHLSTPRSYFFLHLCLSLSSVNFPTAFFNISFSPPISVEALSFHFLSQSLTSIFALLLPPCCTSTAQAVTWRGRMCKSSSAPDDSGILNRALNCCVSTHTHSLSS